MGFARFMTAAARRRIQPAARGTLTTNQQGQSLIQVLMSIAVMSILIMIFSNLFTLMYREIHSLSEKLAVLESQAQLVSVFMDSGVCDFEFKNGGPWIAGPFPVTFDPARIGTANPPVINLNQILSGSSAAAPVLFQTGGSLSAQVPSVVIQSIQILGLIGSAAQDTFPADLILKLEQNRLVRNIHDVSVKINLITTAGPGTMKTITGCSRGANVGRSIATTLANLATYHSACGPGSGYSWFDSPVGSKSYSSGGLLHHCLTACSRYCKSLGYSGGTMSEYSESLGVSTCDCTP